MKWDKEALDTAVQYLRDEGSIRAALKRMEVEYGEEISVDALGKAFNRHGLKPPSEYIEGGPDYKEPEVDTEDIEFENDWQINYDSSKHLFIWRGQNIEMTFGELEIACVLYSKMGPGEGYTSGEVAQYFFNEGYEWASEKFFQWMFKKINFTKRRFPHAPHQVFHSREEIIKNAYNRSDAIIKGAEYKGILKEQKRQIRTLREQLKNMTSMISVTGEALEDAEVRGVYLDLYGDPMGDCNVLIAPISDLHNGKKVQDQPHARPQNVFDQDVFWTRVETYCKLVESLGKEKRGSYDLIHISGLGDYFEALLMNMRKGQFITSDSYGGQQYKAVKDAYCRINETFLNSFDAPITNIIQGGNHDRLSKDKAPQDEEVLAFQLAENIKDYFRDEERITVSFGAAVCSIMLNNGVNLITTHGHLKRMRKDKDFDSFTKIHGYPEADRYLVLQGHYHCFKVLTGYDFRAIWNPAFCGDDGYNLNKLSVGAPPEAIFIDSSTKHDRIIGPFNLADI